MIALVARLRSRPDLYTTLLSIIIQQMENARDLVLLGCVAGLPAVSFARENGAHAAAVTGWH